MSMKTLKKIYLMIRWNWNFKIWSKKILYRYSISKTREKKGERNILENKIKAFEQDLEENEQSEEYLTGNGSLVIFLSEMLKA